MLIRSQIAMLVCHSALYRYVNSKFKRLVFFGLKVLNFNTDSYDILRLLNLAFASLHGGKLLFFVCPIVSDFIAQKATFILNFAYSG
ncbi:hypothetical protein HanXRQr2_Chr11g0481201 [Helianthus annuus]|uniref:Uncharacterized protein n=1 Tax=Helianthus annuus TaxID=4232 RepID=A0A251T9F1_HELAN|nr:hypothetical protein HanXRQr2_Chr11g0481201 [Helianthus annuus]